MKTVAGYFLKEKKTTTIYRVFDKKFSYKYLLWHLKRN